MKTTEWAKSLEIREGQDLGPYRIVKQCGIGGTGVVYLAVDKSDQKFALKVINSSMLSLGATRERLIIQHNLLGDHDCPYLVRPRRHLELQVMHAGAKIEVLVDVTEYVEGHALRPTQVPRSRVRPIVSMVAEATRFLEERTRSLFHRDIKPDNVMVTKGHRKAVLIDLGVLHEDPRPGHDGTLTGSITNEEMMTARYAPPEVVSASLVLAHAAPEDWRAISIYQIGALFYEALFQRRLFGELRGYALQKAILEQDPFEGIDGDSVSKEDFELVRGCLERDPEERLSASWSSIIQRREVRTPVVVLLYCGGTIGASRDSTGSQLEPRKLEREDPSTRAFTNRVKLDLRERFANLHSPELIWRFADLEYQIFSENATPETWDGYMKAVRAVLAEDWSDKYLLGIVLLHGTDTLVDSASSLQFIFKSLPVPLVFTGANNAPDWEDDSEHHWRTGQSDAAPNVVKSVAFLVSGGHRLPMVYVCFADTVCHALNCVKLPLHMLPLRFDAARRSISEPFAYRNVGLGRQYAYKLVGGLYVNNFSPVLQVADLYEENPGGRSPSARVTWKRFDLGVQAPQVLESSDSLVHSLRIAPTAPREIDKKANVHAVTGYQSGTVPRALAQSLRESEWALVTESGLIPTPASYQGSDAASNPGMHKLYRVLPQTAGSMLRMLGKSTDSLSQRVRLFVSTHGLLNTLVGNPVNPDAQLRRATHVIGREGDRMEGALQEYLVTHRNLGHERSRAGNTEARSDGQGLSVSTPEGDSLQAVTRSGGLDSIVMRRSDFALLMNHLVAPHRGVGGAPDAFANMLDAGFWTGTGAVAASGIRENVEQLQRAVRRGLRSSGLASVRSLVATSTSQGVQIEVEYRLRVDTADRPEDWVLNTRAETSFLRHLSHGLPLEFDEGIDASYFVEMLDQLHREDRKLRMASLDWYVVGVVTGALCAFRVGERPAISDLREQRELINIELRPPERQSKSFVVSTIPGY